MKRKLTEAQQREIAQAACLEAEYANRAMELWNVRIACVLKMLREVAEELQEEANREESPLAYLENMYLTGFVAAIEEAERNLHHLLPPCDYAVPSPVKVMQSIKRSK